MSFECCRKCIPPKRHVGCHGECKEYQEQRIKWEEEKKKIKANMNPKLSNYDFNGGSYINRKTHKPNRDNYY